MKSTTDVPVSPTDSVERTARQSSDLSRLSDPRIPLSADEDRDFRAVRAAIFFLRLVGVKISQRSVAAQFHAAKRGFRAETMRAYIDRQVSIEALKNQSGTHLNANTSKGGRAFKHGGTQILPDRDAKRTHRDALRRVSSLTANINIKDGKEETTENDEGEPRPPMSPQARAARANVYAMLHMPIPEDEPNAI